MEPHRSGNSASNAGAFYLPELTQKLPASDIYFDGLKVEVSRYWDWRQGWLPCVMVTLKEEGSFF